MSAEGGVGMMSSGCHDVDIEASLAYAQAEAGRAKAQAEAAAAFDEAAEVAAVGPNLDQWSVVVGKMLATLKNIITRSVGRAFHRWRWEVSRDIGADGVPSPIFNILEAAPQDRSKADLLAATDWVVDKQAIFKSLGKEALEDVAQHAQLVCLHAGEPCFLQSVVGHCFFIVIHGAIGIYAQESAQTASQRATDFLGGIPPGINLQGGLLGVSVATLPVGVGFGEIALLDPKKSVRTASAVARTDSVLLVIGRACYTRTLAPVQRGLMKEIERKLELLAEHPLFCSWNRSSRIHLAYLLKVERYSRGVSVYKQGDPATSAYFVASGTLRVLRSDPIAAVPAGLAMSGHGLSGGGVKPSTASTGVRRTTPHRAFAQPPPLTFTAEVQLLGRGAILGGGAAVPPLPSAEAQTSKKAARRSPLSGVGSPEGASVAARRNNSSEPFTVIAETDTVVYKIASESFHKIVVKSTRDGGSLGWLRELATVRDGLELRSIKQAFRMGTQRTGNAAGVATPGAKVWETHKSPSTATVNANDTSGPISENTSMVNTGTGKATTPLPANLAPQQSADCLKPLEVPVHYREGFQQLQTLDQWLGSGGEEHARRAARSTDNTVRRAARAAKRPPQLESGSAGNGGKEGAERAPERAPEAIAADEAGTTTLTDSRVDYFVQPWRPRQYQVGPAVHLNASASMGMGAGSSCKPRVVSSRGGSSRGGSPRSPRTPGADAMTDTSSRAAHPSTAKSGRHPRDERSGELAPSSPGSTVTSPTLSARSPTGHRQLYPSPDSRTGTGGAFPSPPSTARMSQSPQTQQTQWEWLAV